MLEPVLKLIMNDVARTLGSVAPPAYPVTLNVNRPVQLKWSAGEGVTILALGDPERLSDEETPVGWIGWNQPVLITCYSLPAEDNTVPIDARLVDYITSVEQALLVDVSRGNPGSVEDTIPHGSILDYTTEGFVLIQSTFNIKYRTLYGNPFQPQP